MKGFRAGALAVVISLTFLSSGCSVYMAASKEGAELSRVTSCQTVGCLEMKGAEHIRDGKDNIKYYKLRKPTGSTGRAVLHGLLDVATCGIWELAGTPIEGAYNTEEYYGLKVRTKEDGERIKNIQLIKGD